MDLNTNILARLMLTQLPGLVGVMQPAAAARPSLGELARRQRNQNIANALLYGVSNLLNPSPNRYPWGVAQRPGPGLGVLPQCYNDGVGTEQVLERLGVSGRSGQAPVGRIAQPRRHGQVAPAQTGHKPAELMTASAADQGGASAGDVPVRLVGLGAATLAVSRLPKLRKFTGTLAHRLNCPAVLPGGWKLYGYARDSGSPVYIGPGRQLRVYV